MYLTGIFCYQTESAVLDVFGFQLLNSFMDFCIKNQCIEIILIVELNGNNEYYTASLTLTSFVITLKPPCNCLCASFSKVYLMCECHQVRFSATIYGTFRQSVVLNFGADSAALIQHMTVHCKPVDVDFLNLNKELVTDKMDSWILANRTIIPYEPKLVTFQIHSFFTYNYGVSFCLSTYLDV